MQKQKIGFSILTSIRHHQYQPRLASGFASPHPSVHIVVVYSSSDDELNGLVEVSEVSLEYRNDLDLCLFTLGKHAASSVDYVKSF